MNTQNLSNQRRQRIIDAMVTTLTGARALRSTRVGAAGHSAAAMWLPDDREADDA